MENTNYEEKRDFEKTDEQKEVRRKVVVMNLFS